MLVIAEVGSNHLGSLELALRHIEGAAGAGAGAVKFQLFRAERLDRRVEEQERLRPFEVPYEWIPVLGKRARELGLEFIVTPFDLGSCEILRGEVDRVKIASLDMGYDALVEAAAALGVPMVISTGGSSIDAVRRFVMGVLEGFEHGITLLHCVVKYPAQVSEYSVKQIGQLWGIGRGTGVGISDHTRGMVMPVIAEVMGLDMLEKHFCLETGMRSPDNVVSIDAEQFKVMIGLMESVRAMVYAPTRYGPLEVEEELWRECARTNEKVLRG